ncbi:MAG: hypothetical protein LQ337_006324 [Flavoplaca oasis]|nr:MAG: hypothetical protein LQ337_006324 [Flavoplaca oasis]
MPKAAKPKSRAASSRTNPLSSKSGNTSKAAAEQPPTESIANENVPQEKAIAAPAQIHDIEADEERNYLFTVAMTLSNDPMITRVLSVPPSLTFAKFHRVLQIAFGWAGCHMHTFNIEVPVGKRGIPMPVLILQSTLDGDEDDLGFWPNPQNEKNWTLCDVFERKEWETEDGTKTTAQIQLRYEYDMGDGWDHQIVLLGRAEKGLHDVLGGGGDAPKILCIGGEGHPCAEDCGSAPGWEDLKDAFKKQKGDRSRREWYKTMCANGDPKGLDPYKWDILEVNDQLRTVEV